LVATAVVSAEALAAAAAGPVTEAATAGAARCVTPARAIVTRNDSYVVLYRRIRRDTNGELIRYWGCLRATGRRTRLGEATGKADAPAIANSRFRTSRHFVAYVETSAYKGTAALYVHAFDLRTGRRAAGIPVTGIPAGGWLQRLDGRHTFGIADLAVGDAGGLAWHDVGQPTPDAPAAERIVVHDAAGTRPVQVSPLGALTGPSVSGDTVTWRTGDVRMTYALQR
jgi:hypothetical protein